VVVEAVVGKVGLGTDEPPKARVVSFENVVPLPEPRQLVGRSGPELLRCPPGILDPLLDSRIDRCHRIHPLHSFVVLAGNVVQNRIDGQPTGASRLTCPFDSHADGTYSDHLCHRLTVLSRSVDILVEHSLVLDTNPFSGTSNH